MSGDSRHIVPNTRSSKPEDFIFYERELAGLREREQKVLRLRVGLVDGRKHTLKEVGSNFGISPERARQIQSTALTACRRQREPARPTEPTAMPAERGVG